MTSLQYTQNKDDKQYYSTVPLWVSQEVNWCWKIPCLYATRANLFWHGTRPWVFRLRLLVCECAIHMITHVHSLSQIWKWDLFVASDKTECWIEQLLGSLPGLVFWSSSRRSVTADSFLSVHILNSLLKLWKAQGDFACIHIRSALS